MATQTVQTIAVDFSANTGKLSAGFAKANAETKRFSQEFRAQTREASGSLELLGDELGVRLPRHLRTFVAQLPGVASALSAAFSGIAVIGLANIVLETGEKIADFFKKAKEAADKSKDAWASVHVSITSQNDDLELTKARLQDAIARLEHKPENKLAEAIAEARVEADKLGKTVDDVVKQISEAVKSQESGSLAQIFLKQTGGTKTAGVMKTLQDQLNEIDNGYVQGDPTQLRQQALQQAMAALAPILQQAHNTVEQYKRDGTPLDNSSAYKEYQTSSEAMRNLQGANQNINIQQQVDALSNQKDQLDAAKDLAQEQQELQNKQLQALEAQQQQLKNQKEMWGQVWSPADDQAFWQAHIAAFTKGSEAYNKVLDNIYQATEERSKQFQTQIKDMLEAQQRAARMDAEFAEQQAKTAQAAAAALTQETAKYGVGQARINAQGQLATAQMESQLGQISPHALAQAQAAAHAAEFQEQIQALQQELAELHTNDFGSLSGENTAKEMQVQLQINEAQSKSSIQAMQDAQNEFATTWKGTIASIYDTVIEKAQQTTAQIKQISTQFIDGINTELAKGMTGQKTDFSGVFRNASQSLAKTALEKTEGTALGALGLGKRDGSSASQALYVQMANGPLSGLPDFSKLPSGLPPILGPNGQTGIGSATSTVTGGLLGMLNDSNWVSSLFGGKLFGSGSLFGGHFAGGGDVMGGMPIDVGELGPERFVPYTNGRIIPNNELNTGGTTVHIDASGSNDPAQTEAAIHRAMGQYLPQMAAIATRANHENNARRPTRQ
jgi:hypothetical protein